MMQDPIGIPTCFSSGDRPTDDTTAVTRSGQSVFMSVYRTKLAGQCRLITITWCKNLLLHGLSISIEGLDGDNQFNCKVELKPWYFWRKHGSNRFHVDGKPVEVYWDLKAAKFNGETEPQSDYYVAVVCDEEVVLLVGDLKKDAFRKTGSRPSLIEPALVSKKEHIFGKKKFSSKAKFHEKDRCHEISIECNNIITNSSNISSINGFDSEMEIRVDGHLSIHVKHLQWKFRGLRHALFVFKPTLPSTSPTSTLSSSPPSSSLISTPFTYQMEDSISVEGYGGGSSGYCLFLYGWKVE
ncbi:hypothetical protein AQUCO_01100482v1 [Aquilegia coerulea]|uniref:DUF868 domain-containing protein n=1 Tax=Aquilegia coerulea TaxID=218851 RepID=A0A2G5E7C1_AQUCA|nr:hypothetical protein AQUCO_01100482v1 [Aquilegia coerulea]